MPEPSEKHLEFLQGAIARMASTSFLIKGWSVTLVSALLALAAGTDRQTFAIIAFFPAAVFFVLDGYFLHLERRFRALYEDVRLGKEASPYRISLPQQSTRQEIAGWISALFSRSVSWLHVVILGVIALAAVLEL